MTDMIEQFNNPNRVIPTNDDFSALAAVMREHLKKAENGELGGVIVAVISADGKDVTTDCMRLPGISNLEILGVLSVLTRDTIKHFRGD